MTTHVARVAANRNRPVTIRSLLVTLLLILALAASVHAQELFSPPFLSFATGRPSTSVAIAEVNADGRPDLVTANPGCPSCRPPFFGDSVSVLLGNGDGAFGPYTAFGTGVDPVSVAIADLNGDARADLVTANNGNSNTVSVLLRKQNGTFAPFTDFGTGVNPLSVAIADLNADGHPDLVTANDGGGYGNTVSVLLGNGDGTFGPKRDFGTGIAPQSVAIADVNLDGRPDLVTADFFGDVGFNEGTVSVLLANGDGTFRPKNQFGTGVGPVTVAIADLNVDGRPDLVTANFNGIQDYGNTVSVLLGNGDGTFGPKTDVGTGMSPHSLAIADVNADGRPDIVAGLYYSNVVQVLLGNGDGTWTPDGFEIGDRPGSVAIGDLNVDGRPDLAVTIGIAVMVMLNTGPFPCSVAMSFDFNLNMFNLQSMGHWVTGTLEPEPPALPSDIDIASIRLNGNVPVDSLAPVSIGDADGDGRPDLTVKFDRAAVELAVPEGVAVPVTVRGTIGNGCFSATDVISVVRGHVTAPSAGAVLQTGNTAEVRWDTPAGIQVQSVAVLSSSDDGSTWGLVAHELPNTGSCLWTVSGSATNQARIGVVLVESADPSGYEVTGVSGVSGRFVIHAPLAVGGASVGLSLSGSVPNPGRDLSVSFSLADAKPARLVVYDVSGREVSRREIGSFGAGRHVVTLGAPERLAPGIYLVHLIQGGRRLVARSVVVQ